MWMKMKMIILKMRMTMNLSCDFFFIVLYNGSTNKLLEFVNHDKLILKIMTLDNKYLYVLMH